MTLSGLYPVICSERLADSRDFYRSLLDLEVTFEIDWYVSLVASDGSGLQLAFVQSQHDSVPARDRGSAAGTIITVETDDVDAVFERARQLGLPIELTPRDEAWGQRHFMTRDPNGLLVDVVKQIEPSQEFAAAYSGGV